MNDGQPAEMDSLFFTADAAPPSEFVGRTRELGMLTEWMTSGAAVCIVHGLGGTGKTELVRQALRHLSSERRAIWCSLRDAPDLSMLVAALLTRYPGEFGHTGADPADRLSKLLSSSPTVLVLDNFEAVLDRPQGRDRQQQSIAEEYTRMLESSSHAQHQSAIVVTTRVLPRLKGGKRESKIHALELSGLGVRPGRLLLKKYRLHGTAAERDEFVQRYDGNPLALHLAAELAEDLFGGQIHSFLQSEIAFMGGVSRVLESHFSAITELQRKLLARLATAREPVTLDGILEGSFLSSNRAEVASATQDLLRRSLIERRNNRFYLQYLIQEYVLADFSESASVGIAAGEAGSIADFPLVDTIRPIHVRDAQRRLTVPLLRNALLRQLGGRRPIVGRLKGLLESVRYGTPIYGSFVAANVLELCVALGEQLSGIDFSATCLRHVDVSDYKLHAVDMSQCEFDRCRFASAHEHIFGIALSSNGKFAALGHLGGSIVIVEAPDGRIVRSFDWDAVWLRAVALSPDDRVLAATDDRGRVRIIQLKTGHTIDIPGNGRQIRSLTFSTDGELLFSGGEEGLVRQMDPREASDIKILVEAGSEVWGLACDLDLLAIATSDDGLRLMNLENARELLTDKIEGASGRSVAFSRDGQWVFVGCEDGSVRVWSGTGTFLSEISGHAGPVWSIATAEVDGSQRLFSGSHDGSVRALDVPSPAQPRLEGVLVNNEGPVWPLAVDRSNSLLATVTGSSTVRFWDPVTLEPFEQIRGGFRRTFVVASNDDNTFIATGGQDGNLRLWDSSVGQCLHELPGHRGGLRALEFSPSGQLVASAGEDWDVRVWDASRADLRTVLEGPRNWVWCLAFDPSGQQIAAGSADLKVHIWDLRGKFTSRRLAGHKARVVGVAYSADGRQLVSCSVDGECRLWDTKTWRGRSIFRGGDGATCLAYLGGSRVAVGHRSGRVTVLDFAAPGGEPVEIPVHSSQVLCLRRAPGSGTFFSGSEEGVLARVDGSTRQVDRSISFGARPVRSVAFASRGAELVAAHGTEVLSVVTSSSLERRRTIIIPRQYEGLRITGARGLTPGQLETLLSLGAVDEQQDPTGRDPTQAADVPQLDPRGGGPHVTIFISYSHEDTVHMLEIRKHLTGLEAAGRAEVWIDRMISPGREWDNEIDSRLEVADIVLLLLSADYLASSYCRREMERALDRANRNQAEVVPVVLRHCDWQHLPVGRLQALPDGGAPIVGSPDLDEVRMRVSLGVRTLVDGVLAERSRRPT